MLGPRPKKPLPVPPGTPPRPRRKLPPRPGGLLAAMRHQANVGEQLGVLLIDESGNPGNPETMAQLHVLETAQELRLPIFAIEINPDLLNDPRSHTVQTPANLVGFAHAVINKPRFNAFDDEARPNLQQTLTNAGLNPWSSKLVIMGFATQQCVRLTAVGGRDKPGGAGTLHRGATQRGYTVMTCQDVLRGGNATWANDLRVEFYPHL